MTQNVLGPPPDPVTPPNSPAWNGWFQKVWTFAPQGNFTVATLPAVNAIRSPVPGQIAYATNGRKVGETAGNGSGVPVYWSNGAWRVFSTDAAVTA